MFKKYIAQKITFILLLIVGLASTIAIASGHAPLSLDSKTKTDTIKSLTALIDKKIRYSGCRKKNESSLKASITSRRI